MLSDLRKGGFGDFQTFAYRAMRSGELGRPIGESYKIAKITFSQVRACFG
jgi:hypothetical protein